MIDSREQYDFVHIPEDIRIGGWIMPVRDAENDGSWRELRGEDPAFLMEAAFQRAYCVSEDSNHNRLGGWPNAVGAMTREVSGARLDSVANCIRSVRGWFASRGTPSPRVYDLNANPAESPSDYTNLSEICNLRLGASHLDGIVFRKNGTVVSMNDIRADDIRAVYEEISELSRPAVIFQQHTSCSQGDHAWARGGPNAEDFLPAFRASFESYPGEVLDYEAFNDMYDGMYYQIEGRISTAYHSFYATPKTGLSWTGPGGVQKKTEKSYASTESGAVVPVVWFHITNSVTTNAVQSGGAWNVFYPLSPNTANEFGTVDVSFGNCGEIVAAARAALGLVNVRFVPYEELIPKDGQIGYQRTTVRIMAIGGIWAMNDHTDISDI